MSKPTHPIRKLLAALELHNAATTKLPNDYQKAVARHIKPLLDALEFDHTPVGTQVKYDEDCETCHLLAAWRAKL